MDFYLQSGVHGSTPTARNGSYDPSAKLINAVTGEYATLAEIQRWLIQPALEFANLIRHALAIGEGKLPKLPRGKKTHQTQCVLARALSNGWLSFVGYGRIHLLHEKDATIDLDEAIEAVRTLGFTCFQGSPYDVEDDLDDLDGEISEDDFYRYECLTIMTPTLIATGFLAAFDAGFLPDLILND